MDHLYRIAFLIVFLAGCLQGNPVFQLHKIKVAIESLQNGITCPGSVFYTPTEVETSCTAAALACSITELHTVQAECLDNLTNPEMMRHHINMTANTLQKMIDNEFKPTATSECICEDPELEKPFDDFMKNIIHLAESLAERHG